MTFAVLLLSNLLMIPILILLVIVTVIVIPWIVSRAFSRVAVVAKAAEFIDVDRRGYRLPRADVPTEIHPLVSAINGALQRLDEGYERQRRFILCHRSRSLRRSLRRPRSRRRSAPCRSRSRRPNRGLGRGRATF